MTELEYLESQLVAASKRVEEEKKNEKNKALADDLHKLYNAFTEAGFNEEQAMWFVSQIFVNAL